MSGKHRGVQAIIRKRIPQAEYVHCKAHSLNLAIGHACEEPVVRNMLNTLQQIAFAFDYSAKRLPAFRDSLEENDIARGEMHRRTKLKTLCETRWVSRADSLYTFCTAFSVVVHALQMLSSDGDGKTRGHLCSIKQFNFIIPLCAAEHVLSNTVALSNMLQGKQVNLIEAAKESLVVINVLKQERNDEMVWDELFERAKTIATEWNIEPTRPRLAANQRHRVNVPAEMPKDYWKRALYLPLVDHLLQELDKRLLKHHDRFPGQYLIPTKIHLLKSDTTDKIFKTFEPDLTERAVFDGEMVRRKAKWAHVKDEDKPTALKFTLCCTNQVLYPNVTAILTILLTMPVSTATP